MKKEDLRELLLSIAEEDAIISCLYAFFILKKRYSLEIIEEIILYGVSIGWFEIIDVDSGVVLNTELDWRIDNVTQEIVFCDTDFAVSHMFNNSEDVPNVFKKFLVEHIEN